MHDNEEAGLSRFMSEPLSGASHGGRPASEYRGYECPKQTKEALKRWLDSHTPEQLREEIDKRKHLQLVDVGGKLIPIDKLPWWRRDKFGYPIETVNGRPIRACIRIVCQNIRKLL